MKIKGWDKITGYTYKGMCIVNPIHNADETKYMADVLNLNLPQKPKWELVVLTPAHKFKTKSDNQFDIILYNQEKQSSRTRVSKFMIKSLLEFRMIVEALIDQMLDSENKQDLLMQQISANSKNTGILNIVNSNGITINNTSHSINI